MKTVMAKVMHTACGRLFATLLPSLVAEEAFCQRSVEKTGKRMGEIQGNLRERKQLLERECCSLQWQEAENAADLQRPVYFCLLKGSPAVDAIHGRCPCAAANPTSSCQPSASLDWAY